MKLYEVLRHGPYGYWILDTGELVPIQEAMGHMKYARKVLGPRAEYEDAFDEGWLRIVHSMENRMFIQGVESATPEARKKAWTLLKHHKDFLTDVTLEYKDFYGRPPKPANQAAEYIKSFDK